MFADIKINKKTKQATLKDEPLQLTPNEYQLITYLIDNRNRAVPRAELLDKIWGYEFEVETRVADDTVKRLRKKIKDSDTDEELRKARQELGLTEDNIASLFKTQGYFFSVWRLCSTYIHESPHGDLARAPHLP